MLALLSTPFLNISLCLNMQLLLQVTLAPPPDLVVSSLVAEDNYVTGDVMTILYNISNVGAGESVESYWQDRVVS